VHFHFFVGIFRSTWGRCVPTEPNQGAQANAEVRAAGMVVNTMGWVDGLGYELLLHAIATLRADVVLVVGQDRLFSQLSSELRCARAGPGGDTPQTCEWCSKALAHPLGYGSSARRSCSSVCTYYSQRGLVQLASDSAKRPARAGRARTWRWSGCPSRAAW